MKKIISFILSLILLFSLCSCQNGGESEETIPHEDTTPADYTEIRVAVLNGTTGFGIAPLFCDIKNGKELNFSAKIDFYADATLVAPLVIGESVDIAAVPTNLAAVLYNKTKGAIEVLAVNTLGVLYLIENGESVTSLADLEGKTVYLPGSGSNPEYVLKTLLELSGLSDKVTLDYTYATPDELTAALASGKAGIGVIPEPKVTAATTKNSSLRIALDFSKEWKALTGTELVQGCLIGRKEFIDAHPVAVANFLKAYEGSVNTLNSNAEAAAKAVVEAGIAANESLVKNALPRCNITYLVGDGMKSSLNEFWGALFAQVPSSIGGAIPDEKIFG
ncbi:MAG: ABC transporter substrate-binding protein [Clostridia bacterium]|nr:ABC transporter substrate-binding protein [Clostridia bacterium]